MPADISLRHFRASDLPSLLAIEQQVHLSPWSEQSFQPCLTGRYQCLVATESPDNNAAHDDGQNNEQNNGQGNATILGYAIVQQLGPEAELLNIAVAKNAQGKGIGRQLIQQLSRDLETAGAEQIFLEVRQSNQAAISLYESEGFSELGIRKNYYPLANGKSGREDALILGLTLGNPFAEL